MELNEMKRKKCSYKSISLGCHSSIDGMQHEHWNLLWLFSNLWKTISHHILSIFGQYSPSLKLCYGGTNYWIELSKCEDVYLYTLLYGIRTRLTLQNSLRLLCEQNRDCDLDCGKEQQAWRTALVIYNSIVSEQPNLWFIMIKWMNLDQLLS